MEIVVSGMGNYCACGKNSEALWESIKNGQSGISEIDRFDVSLFDSKYGALVSTQETFDNDLEQLIAYAEKAAIEALDNAEIFDRELVSLVLGTSNGLMGKDIHTLCSELKQKLRLGGVCMTLSTACTSSAHAIAFSADMIKRGHASTVLTGGADLLTHSIFAGFYSLGILSKSPCTPFSKEMGTTLGEGAGFLILENSESAKNRNIKPVATFRGYGLAADGHHDTKPDPFGYGVAKAINYALKDSGIGAEQIGYLNAHGTATAANDSAEWKGIQKAFGNYSSNLPVSSSKSFFGHTQGAAGVLEVATTLLSMNKGMLPPTLNYTGARQISPADPIGQSQPRKQEVDIAVCTNAAFGGVNSSLIFSRNGNIKSATPKIQRKISIKHAYSTHDRNEISNFVPASEIRNIDPSASLLASAVGSVLLNSGYKLRSQQCEETGLFVGQQKVSPESVIEFENSIQEKGIKHLSASAFSRMVVNYAAGVSCRLFGLKGPTATMATSPDSGLLSLILSAENLAFRRDTSFLVAAAVDEPSKGDHHLARSAAILLEADDPIAKIILTSWGIATDPQGAIAQALLKTDLDKSDLVRINISEDSATAGLVALVDVIKKINMDQGTCYLVCNSSPGTLSTAIILEKNVYHET